MLENLKANPVVPHICFVSQSVVGFDGIHPFVLKFIGSDFLRESNASSFLRQVDHDSASFFTNHLQSHPELIAAIAAKRIDQISCEATRMHSNQRGFVRLLWIPCHDCDRFLSFVLHVIDDNVEVAKACRKFCSRLLADESFAGSTISDQIFDRDDFQLVLVRNGKEFITGGTISTIIENLTQNPGRGESGHFGQVDRSFGMPGSAKDTSLFCQQQMNMPGPTEVVWRRLWIHDRFHAEGSLFCRNPGLCGHMVKRRQKRGSQLGVVFFAKRMEIETIRNFWQDRHAEITSPAHQEIDSFWSDKLRCTDVVSFVFPVFVVDHDDDFTTAHCFDCRRNR